MDGFWVTLSPGSWQFPGSPTTIFWCWFFKPLLFPKLRLCNFTFFSQKGGTVFWRGDWLPGNVQKKLALLKTETAPISTSFCEPHQPLYHQLQSWERGGWVLVGQSCSKIYFTLVSLRQMLYMWRKLKKKKSRRKMWALEKGWQIGFGGVSRLGPINVTTNLKHWCWCCATCRKEQEPLQKGCDRA